MVDRVGQQFGNYRLVRLLGKGGFAEVYLGEHVHLRTQAAIKLLTAELTSEERVQFYEEARLIAHLEHDHIVPVLDFGIENTVPYLVMKYAPNDTLRDRHPKGTQVPLATVVAYVKQIAEALHYAHEKKVIHRDIKPQNILLGPKNEIWLSDFGIAAIAHNTASLNTQGYAGTAIYSAPEQIQGKPRPASDQYSLGIIVYEWLTGTPPFIGDFLYVTHQHIYTSPPSLRDRISSISPEVEQVVMKALEKNPEKRFASVQEFAEVLKSASTQQISSTGIREQTGQSFTHPLTQSQTNTPFEQSGLRTDKDISLAGQATQKGSHLLQTQNNLVEQAPLTGRSTPSAPIVHQPSERPLPPLGTPLSTPGRQGKSNNRWLIATASIAMVIVLATVFIVRLPFWSSLFPGSLTKNNTPGNTTSPNGTDITSVSFNGGAGNYALTIQGTGFGNAPQAMPYTGDSPDFRIADNAQLGHAEYGYTGDAFALQYESWSNNEIQVSGLNASPGEAVAIALWNPQTGNGATWGGNAPPATQGTPQITSVDFSGSGQSLRIIVHGSNFGSAPTSLPFTGDLNFFAIGDFRAHCSGASSAWGAGNARWGNGQPDATTLIYQSWSNNEILINGFAGNYGQGCIIAEAGDPITLVVWNTSDTQDTGLQTAWGGFISENTSSGASSATTTSSSSHNSPTVDNSSVQEQQMMLQLQPGSNIYIFGYGTGGGLAASPFRDGQYASVTNANNNTAASLAITPTNADSFTTSATYQVIGGVGVSGYSSYSSFYGRNSFPDAPSASCTFQVKAQGSLIVIVAIAGGEQSLQLAGVSGLHIDASYPGSPGEALVIAYTYLPAGRYTVTEQTSQSAAGQTPQNAGDLIGAFVFAPK